jgi:hypothetical protein
MKKSISRRSLLLALVIPLIAAAAPRPSEYLFVWAMEAKHPQASTQALMSPDLPAWRNNRGLGKDFLAVVEKLDRIVTGSPDMMAQFSTALNDNRADTRTHTRAR